MKTLQLMCLLAWGLCALGDQNRCTCQRTHTLIHMPACCQWLLASVSTSYATRNTTKTHTDRNTSDHNTPTRCSASAAGGTGQEHGRHAGGGDQAHPDRAAQDGAAAEADRGAEAGGGAGVQHAVAHLHTNQEEHHLCLRLVTQHHQEAVTASHRAR